jgi:carbon-monoxide dehydrogenase large subunit
MPCIMHAVLDALRQAGVTHFDMPATPQRLWAAIRAANEGRPRAFAVDDLAAG